MLCIMLKRLCYFQSHPRNNITLKMAWHNLMDSREKERGFSAIEDVIAVRLFSYAPDS